MGRGHADRAQVREDRQRQREQRIADRQQRLEASKREGEQRMAEVRERQERAQTERQQARVEKAEVKAHVKAGKAAAKEQARFEASPQGWARAARERGDQVFQVSIACMSQRALVAVMMTAFTADNEHDVNPHLNAIVSEGWRLLSATTAFVETGQQSRDKLVSTGQNVATSGELVGTYVFVRE